ncbi:MAG: hypothetical protein JWP12_1225 [Bacteroidetes bacterium]|nr:hypothetical protein [Bacteroidota bacterium]
MLDINEVRAAIKKWNDNKNNIKAMDALGVITGFHFPVGDILQPAIDLHAYPAIDKNDDIQFYLISSTYDQESKLKTAEHIVQAGVDRIPPRDNDIPLPTAMARIRAWEINFKSWLDTTIKDATVVEAFLIPGTDLDENEESIVAYFGLIPDLRRNEASYFVDLVLVPFSKTLVFEDTVMPVPPFGEDATARKRFALLP